MRKLYGDSLRKDAGFVKVMKNVASKNAKIIESRAEKHAPELKRVAREVLDTFDKVCEEAADAVEDFVSKCGCFRRCHFRAIHKGSISSCSENIRSGSGFKDASAAIPGEVGHCVVILWFRAFST